MHVRKLDTERQIAAKLMFAVTPLTQYNAIPVTPSSGTCDFVKLFQDS
jgi:hypothetical protein